MSYIEKAANKFGWEIQSVLVDQLLVVLEEEIWLTKLIEEENKKLRAKNDEEVAKLIEKASTAEEAEEFKNINPIQIETKNKEHCLNFWFDKLLEQWKTLLHNIDDAWNLTIKIFKLESSYVKTIKTKYSVTCS